MKKNVFPQASGKLSERKMIDKLYALPLEDMEILMHTKYVWILYLELYLGI